MLETQKHAADRVDVAPCRKLKAGYLEMQRKVADWRFETGSLENGHGKHIGARHTNTPETFIAGQGTLVDIELKSAQSST